MSSTHEEVDSDTSHRGDTSSSLNGRASDVLASMALFRQLSIRYEEYEKETQQLHKSTLDEMRATALRDAADVGRFRGERKAARLALEREHIEDNKARNGGIISGEISAAARRLQPRTASLALYREEQSEKRREEAVKARNDEVTSMKDKPRGCGPYEILLRKALSEDEERMAADRAEYRRGGRFGPEVVAAQQAEAYRLEKLLMDLREAERRARVAEEEYEAAWHRQLQERIDRGDRMWAQTSPSHTPPPEDTDASHSAES